MVVPNLAAYAVSLMLITSFLATAAFAGEREPCHLRDPDRRALFGDLHVHTRFSLDASTQDTRNTPADAYRFARGEELGIQPYDAEDRALRSVRLDRPLDFAAVTDHSELFGEVATCTTPGLPGHETLVCNVYRRWPRLAFFLMNGRASMGRRYGFCGEHGELCRAAALGPWQIMQEAAEGAYDRSSACRFTSFVAYEWTGSGGMTGSNLHRNVIFANATVPELPISFVDGTDPSHLWQQLESQCRTSGTGCDVVVIPHNSNLSAEKMWPLTNPDGSAFTAEQARARASAEPLVEVFQHKGESECRRGAGTEDELCSFEQLPYDTMTGVQSTAFRNPPGPNNFVRSILASGLALHESIGVNPFAMGMIASTDTHLGTPGYVDERRHVGHGGAGLPITEISGALPDRIEFNPGGLAAVWAEENSRESIFAAFRRRETFGTSGPRIRARLFGGWEFPEDACEDRDIARTGYARGVPMGADLPENSSGAAAPTFIAMALKDAGTSDRPGTDLQRVQIVKLWLENGEPRERVFDVGGSPENGAGVDPATCQTRGSGHASLCSVWSDPDFDPGAGALYYARVLENPTCRWSTWACNEAAVDCSGSVPDGLDGCCDPSIPKSIQERAWTSPIWYTP